jgi:glycosyltransferase involved in cell wall biosynthesis
VSVLLAHDYLTQRGGAERVFLAMCALYPDAPAVTAIYEPRGTYPEFAAYRLKTLWPSRFGPFRRDHRLALPVLASAWQRARTPPHDVALCSSSGWAHGLRTGARKVVYCHAPARWLYQSDRYRGAGVRGGNAGLALLRRRLRAWDARAMATADLILANSTATQRRVREIYGRDATLLFPPTTYDADGPAEPVPGLDEPFLLCVSRLLAYKNVEVACAAATRLGMRLVVVGAGPEEARLRAAYGATVTFLSAVEDARLRWLYRHAALLVATAYEDFGLTPVEAMASGTPVVALRNGGYLDTVVDGVTGVLFDSPDAESVAEAVERAHGTAFDEAGLRAHAARFALPRFAEGVRAAVRA